MEPRFSDRNRPEKTPRPAALQGGSRSSTVEAGDNLPEGIVLENGSVVIQGESSATVILGSFHLNCCKGQFFHDKQIASIPQQHLGGGSLPPPPSTALPAWGPESPSTTKAWPVWPGTQRGQGRAGPQWDPRLWQCGTLRNPLTSQGELSPRAAGSTLKSKACLKSRSRENPSPADS